MFLYLSSNALSGKILVGTFSKETRIIDVKIEKFLRNPSSWCEAPKFGSYLVSKVVAAVGQYECQLSTEPKISKVFRLNVTGRNFIKFSVSMLQVATIQLELWARPCDCFTFANFAHK